MSEMIERVARALAEHGGDNWETCLKAPGLRRAGMYRSMARAAIEAMREPTEEMAQEGFQHTGDPCWQEDVKKAYRAMIDEALK